MEIQPEQPHAASPNRLIAQAAADQRGSACARDDKLRPAAADGGGGSAADPGGRGAGLVLP